MKPVYSSSWSLLAINGLLTIALGLVALFLPGEAIRLLVIWFGVFALAGGLVFVLTDYLRSRRKEPWGFFTAAAAPLLIVGLIAVIAPTLVIGLVFLLLGIWAIVSGSLHLISSIQLRSYLANFWMFLLNGVLVMGLGVMLVVNPLDSAEAITSVFGLFATAIGLFLLYSSFRFKSATDRQHRINGGR